ncbi:Rv3654c family TadE-like protein [Streptomyces sp. NPDC058872]|uniref:Rv3654c family TadE-like protein n=1 Tax=Streptomyces sp. NPDC058872 TaxID=3346661 RepID=UPI0036A56384
MTAEQERGAPLGARPVARKGRATVPRGGRTSGARTGAGLWTPGRSRMRCPYGVRGRRILRREGGGRARRMVWSSLCRVGRRPFLRELGRAARRADRGAATAWAVFAACTLCMVFGAVLALGQAVVARHRAGGAADLAALAAADRALWGEVEACAAASRVASAQGAELLQCSVREEVAEVTTRGVHGPYRPEVRSRAGPPVLFLPSARASMAGTSPPWPPGAAPGPP